MNTKKKVFTVIICIALLIITSVFSTIAYFTSEDEVINTFTIGTVDITLDEAKVNEDGKPVDEDGKVVTDLKDAERIGGNSYKLLPGSSYTKDPTITIVNNSKDSYVRMLVTVNDIETLKNAFPKDKELSGNKIYEDYYLEDNLLFHKIVDGYDDNKWIYEGYRTYGESATYEYRYYTSVNGENGDLKLEPLFTSITIPGTVNNKELANLDNLTLTVEGHAIQVAGFDSDDEAWSNWK